MGQEFFGGPEYYQDFDPEKFARELAEKKKQQQQNTENADEKE